MARKEKRYFYEIHDFLGNVESDKHLQYMESQENEDNGDKLIRFMHNQRISEIRDNVNTKIGRHDFARYRFLGLKEITPENFGNIVEMEREIIKNFTPRHYELKKKFNFYGGWHNPFSVFSIEEIYLKYGKDKKIQFLNKDFLVF